MTSPQLHDVPLRNLQLSQTPAQIERRARFDQTKLSELAESIRSVGIVQPIVARPVCTARVRQSGGDGTLWYVEVLNSAGSWTTVSEHYETKDEATEAVDKLNSIFEIVAGERRYLASKVAGLDSIPTFVRNLTDEQVIEVQLIENLQREGLHELAEAEGYEQLVRQYGYTVEQLVDKIGKSRAYVYSRLKLLALCKECRTAFYDGKLSASHFLLLARIPVEELQVQALAHFLRPFGNDEDPLSYREAVEYVHEEFTLRLSEAPFPRDDADLVPGAGTCGACPKRTGNQPELFGDIKGVDVCTDPVCFKLKRAAWNKRQIAKAKESGQPIITGAEARRIQPKWSTELKGYVRPGDKCDADPKQRTYAQLLGKQAAEIPSALLQNPDTTKFSKVYKIEDVAKELKGKGIKIHVEPNEPRSSHEARYAEQKAERAQHLRAQHALFQAIMKAAPAKLGRPEREAIADALFETGFGDDNDVFAALGWERFKGVKFEDRVAKLSDADLDRLLFALTLWPDVDGYSEGRELLKAAKRLKIDHKKIRRDAVAAEAAVKIAAPANTTRKRKQ